jgi:hypothetical protein
MEEQKITVKNNKDADRVTAEPGRMVCSNGAPGAAFIDEQKQEGERSLEKIMDKLDKADRERELAREQEQADAEEMTATYLRAYPALNDIYTLCGRDVHVTLSYLNDSCRYNSLKSVREYADKKL